MAATGRVEFYWADHYGSYAEAKEVGGVRVVHHDYLDNPKSFNTGIAADIREHVLLGVHCVDSGATIRFFLFDPNGRLVDER
jgi:hypothetical protein